ncbi:MAG: hypothetical protein ACLQGP_13950 [Isosphaeraceae bacterium]
MMTTIRAKPVRRTTLPPRGGDASREVRHDPAALSATLRELAVTAHRAVRAAESSATRPGPGDVVDLDSDFYRELVDVHTRIVQFQRCLQAQSMDGLIPYVAALRQKVSQVIGQ